MPLKTRKRRKLLTHIKNRARVKRNNLKTIDESEKEFVTSDREVTTPRGRLKGALMDVLDPCTEDSSGSSEPSPIKRERKNSHNFNKDYQSDDDDSYSRKSPPRQSYVLKLFDRSVDLSQFSEDSPLYPICRAWIANQPKANYKKFGKKYPESEPVEDGIDLPGPEGPPISRIPDLLPEQKAASKDNIDLNYREGALPSRVELLEAHVRRWEGVRAAWLQRAALLEARYRDTQKVLNSASVTGI